MRNHKAIQKRNEKTHKFCFNANKTADDESQIFENLTPISFVRISATVLLVKPALGWQVLKRYGLEL